MDQPCFLRHVALHGLAECLQLGDGVLGGCARRLDGGRVHAQGGDLVRELLLLLGQGGLPAGQLRLPRVQRVLRGSLLLQLGLERLQLSLLAAGAAGQVGKLLFDVFQIFRDRSGQKLHLLVLLRAAQHLVFRLAELAADGSKLKFGLRSGGSGLGRLRLERFKALRECVPFLGQLCKRVRARQNARTLCGRAAGHTAARVHDLPVERDDSHAAAAGTRHAHGVVQRVADHSAAKGVFNHGAVPLVA